MDFSKILSNLEAEGNLRKLPDSLPDNFIDFTSNDYLGLAADQEKAKEFLNGISEYQFSSSASRLLASSQEAYYDLESMLENVYGREVLFFNSGYHANTGILSALASDSKSLIVADKLVHASIIDGIMLSKSEFRRFPHNDMEALRKIIERNYDAFNDIIVVTESVFSMDGDYAPVDKLIELKEAYPKIMLYLDEAHAFGVKGPKGLGMAQASTSPHKWDMIVVPLGKAAASMGAFAICSKHIKDFLVNKARSLIFSTALPPIQIEWTSFILNKILEMDKERVHLEDLSKCLAQALERITGKGISEVSHIQPLIVGNPLKTIEISQILYCNGIKALPIRKPTVPAGTERLRFSLNANMEKDFIYKLENILECNKNIL